MSEQSDRTYLVFGENNEDDVELFGSDNKLRATAQRQILGRALKRVLVNGAWEEPALPLELDDASLQRDFRIMGRDERGDTIMFLTNSRVRAELNYSVMRFTLDEVRRNWD
jgi:hypothetical protein